MTPDKELAKQLARDARDQRAANRAVTQELQPPAPAETPLPASPEPWGEDLNLDTVSPAPQPEKTEEDASDNDSFSTTVPPDFPDIPIPSTEMSSSRAAVQPPAAPDLQELLVELATMRATVARLEGQAAARAASPEHPFHREGSAFVTTSDFAASGMASRGEFKALPEDHVRDPHRKAEAPDPSPFDHDRVTFESWVVELAFKFRTDAAMFSSEDSRVHYAARFVQGRPKAAIEPRLRSETRPFTRVAELVQVLETGFRDTNLAARARLELNKMRFEWKSEGISQFIAHFNALAEDSSLALPLLKQGLFDTLPASINLQLGEALHDPGVTYEAFCQKVTWLAYQSGLNFANRKSDAPLKPKGKAPAAPVVVAPAIVPDLYRSGARVGFGKLTEAERATLRASGGCFRCRQHGHVSAECPMREGTPTPRMATMGRKPEEDDGLGDEGRLGKRVGQGKVSPLAEKVSINSGSSQFFTVVYLGASRKPVHALIDTGASVSLLLSSTAARHLDPDDLEKLSHIPKARDWQGRESATPFATHQSRGVLEIAGRRFPRAKFLVSEHSQYDLLIGNIFLARQRAKLVPWRSLIRWDEPPVRSRQTLKEVKEAVITPPAPPIVQAIAVIVTPLTPPILMPSDEKEEDRRLIEDKVPPWLRHVTGFFSKKRSKELPPSTERDIVLTLRKPMPTTQPPTYRIPPVLLTVVKDTIDERLADGFIERANVANAAPSMLVPKVKGKDKRKSTRLEDWRFCGDYRYTNESLQPQFCQMPQLSELMERLGHAKYFTKIDIRQAFHRLRLSQDSERLTAFKCRYGTFVWKVLPFGLQCGPAHFQQYINNCLGDTLDQFASAYADDVLIWSETAQEHVEHVNEVIQRLNQGGLQGDIKKSQFMVQKVDYLGMVLEVGQGLSIHPDKVAAIWDWKPEDLKNKKAIQSFLGLVNFVRMFYDHASETEKPLTKLLRKDTTFHIGTDQVQAMKTLQEKATSAPTLAFFKVGRETILETDASSEALGGVLFQVDEQGRHQPIGYYSKTLNGAETSYPIQDREMLAVIKGVEFWKPELTATPFTIITDHEALKYFATKRLLSTRQARWSQIMSEFDYTIKYRPGKLNVIADALSRKTRETSTVKSKREEERFGSVLEPNRVSDAALCPVMEEVAEDTVADSSTVATPDSPGPEPLSGFELVDKIVQGNQASNGGDIKRTATGKVWVPEEFEGRHLRTELIREAHGPATRAHCGRTKTAAFVAQGYQWEDMHRDVGRYVRNCMECRRNKIPRDKTPGLLHSIEPHEEPWYGVVVDGKDMPKDRHGHDYIWAFICRLTKFIITIPGRKDDTAETLAKRYFQRVFGWLGMPVIWYSDKGPQFISRLVAYINKATGTKHRFGTSGQASTQGAIEITNQYLDQRLRFYVDYMQDNWSDFLPALDTAHNCTQHDSLGGMTPFALMFAREPRSPLSLTGTNGVLLEPTSPLEARAKELLDKARNAWGVAKRAQTRAQERHARAANKKRREPDFDKNDMVMVSKKGWSTDRPTTRLDSQFMGPFKIKERKGDSYLVDLPDSIKASHVIHASRLRKAPGDPLPGQTQPPPPIEMVDNEPEWTVTKVLASKVFRKKLQYQVEWQGLDPDPTYYDAESFKHAPVRLMEFHERNPNAPGPPKRLQEWIRAAAEDGDPGEHEDDNAAGQTGGRRTVRRH
jgi:hypothetical protein